MTCKQRKPVFFGQVGPNSGVQDRAPNQPHDMFVVQSGFGCPFAIPRGADKDPTEVNLGKVQPLFECVHGAGLVLGAAANLDLAPASLSIEGEQGALAEDLDPAASESGVSSL